jgi:Protein of unknown function (DUF1638)
MSNSPIAPTSTTASSASWASDGGPGQGDMGGGSPPCEGTSSPRAMTEVIACGALAAHIRQIAARRGWPLVVRPLPARLHNRPEKIANETEQAVAAAEAEGKRVVLGYADCGTYGALDDLRDRRNLERLPGLHCYDVLAGGGVVADLFAKQPGTYLLTDYLVRTFDRTVLASLGLDKHPELWPDYFAHYTRVVWLAQEPTPELEAEATRIANLFALPLTTIPTGLAGLESALANLLEGVGPVAHRANSQDSP